TIRDSALRPLTQGRGGVEIPVAASHRRQTTPKPPQIPQGALSAGQQREHPALGAAGDGGSRLSASGRTV
ncbi:hypothetical protein, partial [Vibrio cholerae]|uniref:hypothetical protein n=1 Tax=Vibrio cholerae TaxID=666 RepID=UPI001F37F44E